MLLRSSMHGEPNRIHSLARANAGSPIENEVLSGGSVNAMADENGDDLRHRVAVQRQRHIVEAIMRVYEAWPTAATSSYHIWEPA